MFGFIGQRLNFLKDFFIDPCDAPFTVYAESFAPAALKLIITWFTPDLKNILFNAAKPSKALGRRRSQRKGFNIGKAGRFGKPGVIRRTVGFDQDDWIGRKLQGVTTFGQRVIGNFEFRMWLVYGILERIGFYIFVADIVSDFLYNWFSLVEESRFCQAQRADVMVRERDTGHYAGIFGWIGVECFTILKQRGIISGSSSVIIPAGSTITVTGSSTFTQGVDLNYRYEVRLVSSRRGVIDSNVGEISSNPSETLAVHAKVTGPDLIRFQHRCPGGVGTFDATFAAFGYTIFDD